MPTYQRPPRLRLRRRAEQSLAAGAEPRPRRPATDFEAMFLNSMFSQMTNGLKGEGPFGNTAGTGVWRSMQTEQYSKSFAQAGGVGIAKERVSHADHAASQNRRPAPRKYSRHEPASSRTTPRQPAPATPMIATPAEARKLAEDLMDAMSALLGVIERETELVRAGKIREAMAFESKKAELSRHYVGVVTRLKANHLYLAKTSPDLLATLHRHHDTFRAMLQVNLTVLATAHAVSESIVRGVNAEAQRRNIPTTYGATGRRVNAGRAAPQAAGGQPLALVLPV